MQNTQNYRLAPHSGAIVSARFGRYGKRVASVGVYLLVRIIIAIWMAHLPSAAGEILTKLYDVPTHAMSDAIGRADRDDRLANAGFDARWSAIAAEIKSYGDDGNDVTEPPF